MRIIVCVKQVPDMSEARMDREANTIVREGVASIINPYDIHAVEEGLRIIEKYGGSVTALSMGIPRAAETLKQVIGLGVNNAVLLTDKAFAGSDTLATCYTLSLAVKKINGFDMILCGKQTIDGDTAQVGPGLAEKLNIPYITNVVQFTEITNDYVVCKRLINKGWELVKTFLPALITVEKDINTPRFPCIKGIRKTINPDIKVWNAEDINAAYDRIGLKGSPTQVVKTFIPQSRAAAETIHGTAVEQAKKLISIFEGMHIKAGEKA
jgi:electron transfer flavoprotein beta subunit